MSTYIVYSTDCHDSGGTIEGIELITNSRKKAYDYIKKSASDLIEKEGYFVEDKLEEPDQDKKVNYINDNLIDHMLLNNADEYSYILYKLFKIN